MKSNEKHKKSVTPKFQFLTFLKKLFDSSSISLPAGKLFFNTENWKNRKVIFFFFFSFFDGINKKIFKIKINKIKKKKAHSSGFSSWLPRLYILLLKLSVRGFVVIYIFLFFSFCFCFFSCKVSRERQSSSRERGGEKRRGGGNEDLRELLPTLPFNRKKMEGEKNETDKTTHDRRVP
jgi:hypothetical protein